HRVDVQVLAAPPGDAGERLPPGVRSALPLRVVPEDPFLDHAGAERVVDPGPRGGEALANIAGDQVSLPAQSAVEPVGLLAVGVAHVVHLHHDLQADPLFALDRPQVDLALEGIPPGLPAGRTPAHFLPVRVGFPALEIAGLDLGDEAVVALGTDPRSAQGPAADRV